MEIKCLKEFDLGMELGQVRSVPVSLGKDMPEAVLFVYSSQGNLDPWPALFNYPKNRPSDRRDHRTVDMAG